MGNSKAATLSLRRAPCFLFQLRTGEEESDRAVYLAGNFNNWNTRDEQFKMTMTDAGQYELCITPENGWPSVLEYKYHRGSWDEVELDENGEEIPNRRVDLTSGSSQDQVALWKLPRINYRSEFLPKIQVISEAFEIPQLIKTRRIAALLPYDYDLQKKHYPVLYLQDGQNLFDDFAPFGSWGVDRELAVMAEQGLHEVIIIAIDHAEKDRIAEFTPGYRTRLGVGQGKKYVSFLADTLKPYIDRHFRTLPDREHTGIGGSSMGGLISIYAGLMYPDVYSKLMIFSPSLWVAPNIHAYATTTREAVQTRAYLYGGEAEGPNVVPNLYKLKVALEAEKQSLNIQFKLATDPEGEHNEKRWGEEFPRAMEWLFFSDQKK